MDSTPLKLRVDPFTAAINGTPEHLVYSPSWHDSAEESFDDSSPGATNWVVALCSITFDLDVGQQVEECYPPDALSPEEHKDIAFHAFPDSMSMELHSKSSIRDSLFFFRVRRRGLRDAVHDKTTPLGSSPCASSPSPTRDASICLSNGSSQAAQQEPYLYGYVFCRQRQDSSLRRGGEQRSVVVISEHPYTSVLRPLSQVAGPLFFTYGLEALIQVFSDVCSWPAPKGGMLLQLPVGGLNTISAMLPAPALLPMRLGQPEGLDPIATRALGLNPAWAEDDEGTGNFGTSTKTMSEAICDTSVGLGLFGDMDLFTPLKSHLSKLWMLWELALVGEPLVVVAPSPSETSTTVAAIASLISPLPYSKDFRPYFTIHDPQFSSMVAGGLPGPSSTVPRLIGITNLYFLKVLYPAWQNVLAVGHRPSAQKGPGGMASAVGVNAPQQGSLVGNAVRALRRRQQGPMQLMGEHCEMLWTPYRALVRPDQKLLNSLIEVPPGSDSTRAARVAGANSAAIRRHFEQLTSALLAPFKPYIVPEMPPTYGPLPDDGPRELPDFDEEEWLENQLPGVLGDPDPVLLQRLGSIRAIADLYRRLLAGANFKPWMQRRQQAALTWQTRTWELAAAARQAESLEYMDEVTMVQAFYSLEKRLEEASSSGRGEKAIEDLKGQLRMLFEAMPMDLQQTLLSSPARSLLIQGLLLTGGPGAEEGMAELPDDT